jgi:predicted DCC family thiol-disulfide oxidoreductase YuxK
VLYDGECGFCTRSIRFIADRDRRHRFCFAPLHGRTARSLPQHLSQPAPSTRSGSLVVVTGFRSPAPAAYTTGRALKVMLRQLGGGWRIAGYLLWLVPPVVLDWAYGVVAANRHRLSRNNGTCPLPTAAVRERMLD